MQFRRGLVFGEVNLHMLKKGRVRIGEADLKVFAVVDVTVAA